MTSFSAVWLSTMDWAHSARVASVNRSLSPEDVIVHSVIFPSFTVAATFTVLKLLVLSAV